MRATSSTLDSTREYLQKPSIGINKNQYLSGAKDRLSET